MEKIFNTLNSGEQTRRSVDNVLRDAIKKRASDVHFEPTKTNMNVRFRIDGVLYSILEIPKISQEITTARLKVISNMDVAEFRLPQDGSFEFHCNGNVYNIRTSSFPTIYGEAVTLRIFCEETNILQLENLGFTRKQLETLNRLIASPYGLILITGPSGSGKTTLLFSIINTLKGPGKNIITLEDPVEYPMSGVRQIEIKESIGLSFPRVLKGILRQDPDIVMVGEVRDTETAQIVIQAALTGILVLSTFHTLDVSGVISRLIEMDIPRSVIAHIVEGIVSVRIVRRICPECKEPYKLSDFEKKVIENHIHDREFFKGKGCEACNWSGYLGRIGIFEVIPFDYDIRSAIVERKSASGLRAVLQKKNIETLKESAIEKVLDGITTIEELIRVVGVEFPEADQGNKEEGRG